jgi:predicted ABC-type exoprotein transport system permease subunit
MSTAFGIAALGLVIGLAYDLYVVSIRHAQLESVLGNSITYNKTLGGLGILGLVLFFAFLFSAIADKKQEKSSK